MINNRDRHLNIINLLNHIPDDELPTLGRRACRSQSNNFVAIECNA